jgi:hypothetical protein
MFMGWLSFPSAQQLLDKVVARVGSASITLTDVQAAMAFGLVEGPPGDDPMKAAVQQMIDRQLMLAEVVRFPPAEPDAAAIAAQVEKQKAAAGSRLATVMQSTGLDDERIRDLARDTLRIQAYLTQRFGAVVQVTDDEAAEYFRTHRTEFMRNGALMSQAEAMPQARERAAAERRRSTIARWLSDLRARAEIVVL